MHRVFPLSEERPTLFSLAVVSCGVLLSCGWMSTQELGVTILTPEHLSYVPKEKRYLPTTQIDKVIVASILDVAARPVFSTAAHAPLLLVALQATISEAHLTGAQVKKYQIITARIVLFAQRVCLYIRWDCDPFQPYGQLTSLFLIARRRLNILTNHRSGCFVGERICQ